VCALRRKESKMWNAYVTGCFGFQSAISRSICSDEGTKRFAVCESRNRFLNRTQRVGSKCSVFVPNQSLSQAQTLDRKNHSRSRGGQISMGYSGGVWFVWASMICAATFGLFAERTSLGAALSASLCAMFTTLVMTNIGMLPNQHVVYDVINSFLVPMAVPLLLFSANLRRVLRDTGSLLRAFVIGSVGTILGTVVAMALVPLRSLGSDSWKVASMLCARHIGGAVNFVAVAEALQASGSATTVALAADNLLVALYFMLLFGLSSGLPDPVAAIAASTGAPVQDSEQQSTLTAKVTLQDIAIALSISALICTAGQYITISIPFLKALGMIPVVTLLVLGLVTLMPRFFERLSGAANILGILFMQLFFAAAGASGSISAVLKSAPSLFAFILVQLAIHLAFVLGVGSVFQIPRSLLLVSSNANVGGPTTAAGFATSKNWVSLIVPALLVGVFGYSIATFASVVLGRFVLIKM